MKIADELFTIADRLKVLAEMLDDDKISQPLQQLEERANRVGRAWSGSWLGYHSRVYYGGFADPPPGARFSKEWGMMKLEFSQETVGNWKEHRFDDVLSSIQKPVPPQKLDQIRRRSCLVKADFDEEKSQVLSILSGFSRTQNEDSFLKDIVGKVDEVEVFDANDFIRAMRPHGQIMSRDSVAIQSGLHTPPHIAVLADVAEIRAPFSACEALSKLSRRAASHILNSKKHATQDKPTGTHVFIGHGRAPQWKDLKDFIQDRMHLPWDEFNRVPVAGLTNVTRLSQMLDQAAIAFLVLTAEDEHGDGLQYARQNVIHEAGLFQGRLGFERAIILLEDCCEEFSNIHGLGQIRFPKGKISAVFEEIRRVLEREGLVDGQ